MRECLTAGGVMFKEPCNEGEVVMRDCHTVEGVLIGKCLTVSGITLLPVEH